MNLYTSYGTYGFLNQIKLNNPDHQLFQFSASDTSVILEETDENLFSNIQALIMCFIVLEILMKIISTVQCLFLLLRIIVIN